MNNKKIEEKLVHIDEFIGVYPSDIHCLPRIKNYPSALISNLDNHFYSGSHWIAMYFNDEKNVDYFDSFGNFPIIPSHVEFMEKYAENIIYNNKVIQSPFSITCGAHCINFIILKSMGYSFKDVINTYSNNKEINDAFVYHTYH